MKNNFIYVLLLSLFFSSCMFYSFKGSIPVHIKSIYLMPVVNRSTEFMVSEVLNDELNQLIVQGNLLDISIPGRADSQLEVEIISVMDKPYTVSLSETEGMEEVEQWRITIKSKIIWYDIKNDEILLKKNISNWGIYAPGLDISMDLLDNDGDGFIDGEDSDETGSARESAMSISVRRLSLDIVNEISNTW